MQRNRRIRVPFQGALKGREKGAIPEIPVYVDSPLAEKATKVFSSHPECFDAEIQAFLADGGRPFYPPWVRYTANRDESIALNGMKGPFIVISSPGPRSQR